MQHTNKNITIQIAALKTVNLTKNKSWNGVKKAYVQLQHMHRRSVQM